MSQRYYVLRADPDWEGHAWIASEFVVDSCQMREHRKSPDDQQARAGFMNAGDISKGDRVLTREELIADKTGRRALRAWEQRDDTQAERYGDWLDREMYRADIEMLAAQNVPEALALVNQGFPWPAIKEFVARDTDEAMEKRRARPSLRLVDSSRRPR
jgi:hypothetical protein